jgi:Peptidase family M28
VSSVVSLPSTIVFRLHKSLQWHQVWPAQAPAPTIYTGVYHGCDTVVGSPGANDNASGVSALLEISRLFASIEPVLTVRFVAFVNEEAPFFTRRQQGSMVYAEAARRRSDD